MRIAIAACLGLAALTLLLPSAPTYDPWSWINWGREIARLDLNTLSGPSWKPLPIFFTVPFSLAGEAAPALWLLVARAGGLLAVVMAWRLAARLTGSGALGVLAGAVAGVSLAVSDGVVYTLALGNSEGLLIAFVLWAVERHLEGRRDHAFLLGVLAALLRPEAWPFLGLYALLLWWPRSPGQVSRPRIAAGLAVVPALWFLPELWGSGQLLRAATRATEPTSLSPAFADRPALAVLARGAATLPPPTLAGLALAAVFGALDLARRPRRRALPALMGGAAAWTALVAAMTEGGYSGNFRYLLVPVALACVLGGAGWARLAAALAARLGPRRPRFALAAGAVLLVAASAPFAGRLLEGVPREAAKLGYEAELYGSLADAVAGAGGRDRVLRCGPPVAGDFQVPGLAWRLDVHGIDVGLDPSRAGMVFRAPPVIGAPPEPRLHSARPRPRPVARAGPWQVFASCPSPRG